VSDRRCRLALVSLIALATVSPSGLSKAARADDTLVEKLDLVYARRGDIELGLDVVHPMVGAAPRPIVVCIHGGGWRGGNRQGYRGLIRQLAERGYVAATVSYRLSDVATWPSQMDDVRDAVAWVRTHAAEFGGDAARIGVLGHSAGGHLSLMLGVRSDRETNPASSVQAVANYFGPSDLRRPAAWPDGSRALLEHLAGGAYEGDRMKVFWDASPVTHLSRGDAPVLTFHGTGDAIVPFAQATMLHRELDRLGVPNRLEVQPGLGHGWGGDDRTRTDALTFAFFDDWLKGSELPLVAFDDFESGSQAWEFTDAKTWRVDGEDGRRFLRLFEKTNDYKPAVRSPYHIALAKGAIVGDFVLDVTMRSTIPDYGHRDLCLYFGHQGPSRFYYVHLGKQGDDHANSIFLVNDSPRTSIARERSMSIDWDDAWHRVRIRRSVADGSIEVFFDDLERPVMAASDRTFLHGRTGVGSFDDTGDFDEFRLRGRTVAP